MRRSKSKRGVLRQYQIKRGGILFLAKIGYMRVTTLDQNLDT
ncbi:hypothetical protein ASZ90_017677 [hydrocarbon metagenome]|uniref:Resolvase/invertase-type recombinase catalytic domain-containing protein n=1 Tax=hydrocarbon metagenome TaxID=938273 RepID=A0A0W8E8I4_9ZZZZ